MNCPRCQRLLIGRMQWCSVHGDQLDFGPYAGESQHDRRQIARQDRLDPLPMPDPIAEAEDCAVPLSFPGWELPRERPRVLTTMTHEEEGLWLRAQGAK